MIEIKVDKGANEVKTAMEGKGFDVFRELVQAINCIVMIINEQFDIPYDKIYKTAAEVQSLNDDMMSSIETKEMTEK